MATAKATAIPKMAKSIWGGLLSKRTTSPCSMSHPFTTSISKKAKTHGMVAIKAVAHKLARACYDVMRDQAPFEIDKTFA